MVVYVLSGKYKGQKVLTPDRVETRPATSLLRSMVFDSSQTFIEGANVLDLFAGSGAMGIEALSRGASSVTFNDLSGDCIEAIRENLNRIDATSDAEVINSDAFSVLENIPSTPQFDLILLHPPYPIGYDGYLHLIELMSKRKDILTPDAHIFLETPGKIEKELTTIIEIHFKIKKCKGRSTWSLFHLVNL